MNQHHSVVRSFLENAIGAPLESDDVNFFERGFVNSLFAMKLVLFVEQRFDVVVENEDLELANFSSVNRIVSFVERKLAARATDG